MITYGTLPSPAVVAEFEASVVRVERWLDIYETDNLSPWMLNVPVVDGTVTVDMDRDERRNFDVTFDGKNIAYGPNDGFWYDKVLKPFRGIRLTNGDIWVTCLGEFLPDLIDRPRFPQTFHVTCRDFTKKLLLDKFSATTTFVAGTNVTSTIKNICLNGGITKFNWTDTLATLPASVTFDRMTERWKSAKELAGSIGMELFFDSYGYLTLRPFIDPISAPLAYTFQNGPVGNLVEFSRSTNDTLMFNHVVVYGDSQTNALVFGEASNTNPGSPTRISRVGRRMYPWPSQFVADNTQATSIATSLLSVMGLEAFEMHTDSIVVPWAEAGNAVEVRVSDAAADDPTRYLLTNFSIPMGLTAMSATTKRVTLVG